MNFIQRTNKLSYPVGSNYVATRKKYYGRKYRKTSQKHQKLTLLLTRRDAGDLKPEWIRVNECMTLFGIKRTKLYELINSKRIKSVELKDKGNIRGIRLISYQSMIDLLEGLYAETQSYGKEVA